MPPLDVGTRLLQIGPFKTGTTAIQHAASAQRDALASHGVIYPGAGLNHRWGCSALVGFTWGWTRADSSQADPEQGEALLREIEGSPPGSRVWLSYERLAVLDTARATALCEKIGGPVHVLVGLRPLQSLLPSEWQQLIRSGRRPGNLDAWALRCLDGVRKGLPSVRHLDHAGLVERWAKVVGPEAVTCVIVDRAARDVLPRTVERLLNLPDGMLQPPDEGHQSNRSLTAPELALMSAVADALREGGISHREYQAFVGRGIVRRLQEREPSPEEPRIRLGADAAERARLADAAAVERVRQAGVRVVGDLDAYGRSPIRADGSEFLLPDEIPVDVAVAAVLGLTDRLLEPNTRGQGGGQPPHRSVARRVAVQLRRAVRRVTRGAAAIFR